ncbi:MAG TPA: L-seryl-tRNA(Sec) selenium transferase [Myxococcota bacterium]|nr:L-seryl-tRNA(Sec) selenium transferase [Myxococcota bacterium]
MYRSPEVKPDPRRALPAVDRLAAAVRERDPSLPRWAALEGSRRALAVARERLSSRGAAAAAPVERGSAVDECVERACELAAALAASWPRRVVNATGIPLHTNLGRAPLARGAARAAAAAAASYSNLEYDLASGSRGDRLAAVCAKLALLARAPAALAVNNNAAALLLALDTLARGREVIVSRGELIEIGGSFRLPEIAQRAGVDLVEVGTTNRTHLRDYERAIGPRSALLLKVHRSNFELRGYVAEASLEDLAQLARSRALPVVEDLGSGTLVDLGARGLPAQSYAPARLALGADAVFFSADKLLGGPQAGLVLGSRAVVEAMRGNPLARALRLDKLCLAALDWTLDCYLDGRAERELPVLRQLLAPLPELELRARSLAERLEKAATGRARICVEPDRGFAGGGSLPGFELPGWVVALRAPAGAERVAQRLRAAHMPVVARVRDDALIFDVRTLLEGDEEEIERSLAEALAELGRAG